MAQELITLWSYRTGGVETADRIRSGLAFDLTHLDLRNRRMVSACVQMTLDAGPGQRAAVRLSDPSDECEYGRLHGVETAGELNIALTGDAMADLIEASGAFFAVAAEITDEHGQPQRLASHAAAQMLVVTLAESRLAAA